MSSERSITVRLMRVGHHELPVPSYQTGGSAGVDLAAAVDAPVTLAPLGRALIPTGFAMAIPAGYEGQLRPRSGLALRHGITLVNSPGTIDSDYRGEVKVLLINLGQVSFVVRHGDRIAQLIVAPVTSAAFELALVLDDTLRGAGGYGSTGV